MGIHVYPWWIHVNVWQNQYSIVEKNKVKIKIKKKIEENNRMGKTRELFKRKRETKENFIQRWAQ